MTTETGETRDLRDYLRPVLTRWWLFLAVVPLVTVGTYLYYDHKPKTYTAATQLYVQPSTLDQLLLGNSPSATLVSVENLSVLIQTHAVAARADKILAAEHARPEGGISAVPVEKTSFITITANSPTPVGAAKLANAYAKAFVGIQAQQLRGEATKTLETAENQLRQLRSRPGTFTQRQATEEKIQTLRLIAAQSGNAGIRQVQRAFAPASPTAHEPGSHAIFAFVLSMMLVIGAAYGLEYMSRKIKSVEDAEEVFALPVLTEVPKVDTPAPFDEQGAQMPRQLQEPFRRLQMNLEMLSHERPLRTILVASAAPGEGKSVVARNLALAYREAGRNVALVDADFRKATLGRLLAAREGPGLADILAGHATFGQTLQEVALPPLAFGNGNGNGSHPQEPGGLAGQVATASRNDGDLALIPAGLHHANLATALSSGNLEPTLNVAAETYDTVIIDSSPLLATADVLPLLSAADGVVIVTRVGVSTRDSAQRLLAELERVPRISLVGIVANGIPPRTYRTRAYGYYYG